MVFKLYSEEGLCVGGGVVIQTPGTPLSQVAGL